MSARHGGGPGHHIPSAPRERHAVRTRTTHEYSEGYEQQAAATTGAVEAKQHEALVDSVFSGQNLVEGGVTIDKLRLQDEWGSTILTSAGFGDTWRRFVLSGVYNSAFAITSPTIGDILGPNNRLPFWDYTNVSGGNLFTNGLVAYSASDTTVGSGKILVFDMASGAAGDEGYVEQIVPAMQNDMVSNAYTVQVALYSPSGSPNLLEWYVKAQPLKADGTTTGSESSETGTLTNLITAGPMATTSLTVVPPSDAYFIRLRLGMKRGAAATTVTGQVHYQEVRVIHHGVRLALTDITDETKAPGKIHQAGGKLTLAPTGTITNHFDFYENGDFEMHGNGAGDGGHLIVGGTAFPNTPSTGGQYYRSDLGMWFFWNGAQWLSTELFTMTFEVSGGQAISATATYFPLPIDLHGGTDIYVEDIVSQIFVASGGTALSGSHSWVATIAKRDSANTATTLATHSVNSGSSAVWRTFSTAVNAVLGGTYYVYSFVWTKTGTPGTLNATHLISYRVVG